MKKNFIILFLLFVLILPFYSCKKEEFSLCNYVSEYRENIYLGESQNYKLKAYYGYKVNDFNGEKIQEKNKIYTLTFFLTNISIDNASYYLDFSLNGKTYSDEFSFSLIKNTNTVEFEIEKTDFNQIEVKINKASDSQTVLLKSIIPVNTISFKEAMNSYYIKQQSFVDGFFENEIFNAKLIVRIVEKNNNAYYYIGLTDSKNKTRACLIDGKNGEILATREIF